MCNYSEYIFEKGFKKGFEEGIKLAKDKNIKILISSLCKLGVSENVIINKVSEEYDLSREVAKALYNSYKKSQNQ